jgi:hypothetical protein
MGSRSRVLFGWSSRARTSNSWSSFMRPIKRLILRKASKHSCSSYGFIWRPPFRQNSTTNSTLLSTHCQQFPPHANYGIQDSSNSPNQWVSAMLPNDAHYCRRYQFLASSVPGRFRFLFTIRWTNVLQTDISLVSQACHITLASTLTNHRFLNGLRFCSLFGHPTSASYLLSIWRRRRRRYVPYI